MNSTPKPILYIVVIAISTLSVMGLGSLCYSLFVKVWADPSILTAIITLTSGLIGALTGMLMNTRQPHGNGNASGASAGQFSATIEATSAKLPEPEPAK